MRHLPAGGTKYPLAFGGGHHPIHTGRSIYFGGSDSGRMLVTALCQDHAQGKPFFTLTQNALSDGRYMDYLRAMYGKQISLPTTNDVQAALEDYKADALRRLKHDEEFPRRTKANQAGGKRAAGEWRVADEQSSVGDGRACAAGEADAGAQPEP